MGLIDGAGGSGGFLGGLGQMLDPLGLFGGGEKGGAGGGDMLNKILDPLGIFPALQGEIDKAMKHEADPSVQKSTDAYADHLNGTQDSTVTEMPPAGHENVKADDGYANDHTNPTEGNQSASDVQSQHYEQNAQGTQNTQGTQSTQTGADGKAKWTQDPEIAKRDGLPLLRMMGDPPTAVLDYQYVKLSAEEQKAAESDWKRRDADEASKHCQALITNWDWIQKNNEFDHDGWADIANNIDTILAKAAAGQLPGHEDVVAACKWLKTHPEAYNVIAGKSGSKLGAISLDGLQKYQGDMLQVARQNTPSNGTGGTGGAGGAGGSNTLPPVTATYGGNVNVNIVLGNSSNQVAQPTTPPAGSVGAVGQQGVSLEAAIGKMDGKLATMQETMDSLTNQVIAGIDSDDPQVKKAAEVAKQKLTMLNLKFQSLMELRKQMYELLSNLFKNYHDMSMHAIGNMR